MLIFTNNCIKLKSMIRENVKSLKNIKHNLYDAKKDSDSIQIDLKKLKEEFINNFNKRAKIRSIIFAKIKTYNFKRRIRAQTINNIKIKTNIASSKNNAACRMKDSSIIDPCTSTDDLIVKNYVYTCTSTDDLIVKNYVDASTSTDGLIVKNYVDACTSTDDVCTNENEPCTNENESCTNENENEPCTNDDDDEDDEDEDDDDDSDIAKLPNLSDEILNELIYIRETRKFFLINIKKDISNN